MTAHARDPQGASRPPERTKVEPTPGPWTVDALTNGFAVSSKGTDAPWPPHVADVWREADARLIAAAPRMRAEIDDSLLEHFSRAGKDCECHGCYRKRALLREIHGGQS